MEASRRERKAEAHKALHVREGSWTLSPKQKWLRKWHPVMWEQHDWGEIW